MKIGKSLLFIVIAAFLLAGCKDVSEDIVGAWNFQTFDNQPQGKYTWTFKDDGTVIRMLLYDAVSTYPAGISIDTADYVVDKSLFKTNIVVTGSDPLWTPKGGTEDINGVYRIDKFKEDILILTRIRLGDDSTDGAYLRCEMMRKN